MTAHPLKSEAHRQVAALLEKNGPVWLEKTLSLSEGTARAWIAAGRTPQPRIRERVREILGIPVEAWGKPPRASAAAPSKAPPAARNGKTAPPRPVATPPAAPAAPAGDSADPTANALAVLRVLRSHLEKARPDDVPKIANAITSSSRLLARLSGQLEITESQIVRSVPWRKAMGLLEAALAQHPAAARAVAEAFEGFGQ